MIETAMLLAALWAGSGDIYRCVDDQGVVRFGDQPCADAPGEVLQSLDEPVSEARLRRWLESLEDQAPAARPAPQRRNSRHATRTSRPATRDERPADQAVHPVLDLVERPAGRGLFVACSAQFFDCTNGDLAFTDGCISRIDICSGGTGSGCCHAAYVHRYETLRAAGIGRHAAVRYALLGLPE